MEIFSAGTSELGMNKLCGKNDEQHIYIPVESVQVRVNIHDISMFIYFNSKLNVAKLYSFLSNLVQYFFEKSRYRLFQ